MGRALAIVVSLALATAPLLKASRAAAQDTELAESPDEEDTPEGQSRLAFRRGQSMFQRGNYMGAANAFREANELSPRPELLYNIGLSEDRDEQPRAALEAYEGYLAQVSDVHPRRAAVERRVRQLRTQLAADDVEATEDPGPGPWVLAGIGGVATIVGGILLGVGISDRIELDNMAAPPSPERDEAYSNARTMAGVGIGMLAAGVLALVGGLYWGVSTKAGSGSHSNDDDDGSATEPSASIDFGPSGIRVYGSF